jgi:uncharacterized cupin superfamily protein
MVPEAPQQRTEHGLTPDGEGWFVLNAREATWRHVEGRTAYCDFEGPNVQLPQLGLNVSVLAPGEAMARYHWEADQEDFLVLAGEPLLIIEGQERALQQWDFVHCPAGAAHVIVGAGEGPSVVIAVGARDRSTGEDWGAYPYNDLAARYGASAPADTTSPQEAYAGLPRRQPSRYRPGWLPD